MWKDIKGWEKLYEVNENGEVRNKLTGNLIVGDINNCGYHRVCLYNKQNIPSKQRFFRHRLVAELFIPNPNNLPEVDHKDANRMNPSKENLEWVTHEENVKRAYARGNHVGRAVGENNPRVKMNAALVLRLRAEYGAGATIQELAEKYNHPWSTIGNAVKGYTWKHLSA